VLALFTHVFSNQNRTATRNQADRVATGMGIDAKKSLSHFISEAKK
jgi:hypothetical protein